MASINCKMFHRPNGVSQEVELKSIRSEDANWLIGNGIKVSMEEIAPEQYAVYADYGGEEEYIELSNGRNCWETMAAMRIAVEKLKNE